MKNSTSAQSKKLIQSLHTCQSKALGLLTCVHASISFQEATYVQKRNTLQLARAIHWTGAGGGTRTHEGLRHRVLSPAHSMIPRRIIFDQSWLLPLVDKALSLSGYFLFYLLMIIFADFRQYRSARAGGIQSKTQRSNGSNSLEASEHYKRVQPFVGVVNVCCYKSRLFCEALR